MKWILIWAIATWGSGNVEFNSQRECKDAKAAMLKEIGEWRGRYIDCHPKSVPDNN